MKTVYLKHKRHMDVAIKLTKALTKNARRYYVTGKYVNMGFVETFELGVPVSITVPVENIENWEICINPRQPSIRKSTWKPVPTSKK